MYKAKEAVPIPQRLVKNPDQTVSFTKNVFKLWTGFIGLK